MSSLVVMCQSCPSEYFSAVITATIDGAVDKPQYLFLDDPELTYFKTHLKFRDADIQHTIEDAITILTVLISRIQLQMRGMSIFTSKCKNESIRSLVSYISLFLITCGFVLETRICHVTMPVLEDSELDFHLHGSYSGKPVGPKNAVIYGFDVIDGAL